MTQNPERISVQKVIEKVIEKARAKAKEKVVRPKAKLALLRENRFVSNLMILKRNALAGLAGMNMFALFASNVILVINVLDVAIKLTLQPTQQALVQTTDKAWIRTVASEFCISLQERNANILLPITYYVKQENCIAQSAFLKLIFFDLPNGIFPNLQYRTFFLTASSEGNSMQS